MPSPQMLAMGAVITVLLLPLLLVYSTPFLLVAAVLELRGEGWLGQPVRRILACGIFALGIAPAYDAYLAPQPIYVRLLAGESVPIGAELLSLVLTWTLVALLASSLVRLRAPRGRDKGVCERPSIGIATKPEDDAAQAAARPVGIFTSLKAHQYAVGK